jgi:hypothetical protein
MKQVELNDAMRGHGARTRAISVAAGLAVVMAAGAALSSVALAESDRTPRADPQVRLQAPIGHRQPRAADLPPNLERNEGARTPGQRAFDSELNICRGC